MVQAGLKIFSMSLGFCLLLSSIIYFTAPGPNAPPQSVATGMLGAGIILLGWPIYTFLHKWRRRKTTSAFNAEMKALIRISLGFLAILVLGALGAVVYDRFSHETAVESFDVGDEIVFVENTAFHRLKNRHAVILSKGERWQYTGTFVGINVRTYRLRLDDERVVTLDCIEVEGHAKKVSP